jgi:hypothetical protein
MLTLRKDHRGRLFILVQKPSGSERIRLKQHDVTNPAKVKEVTR